MFDCEDRRLGEIIMTTDYKVDVWSKTRWQKPVEDKDLNSPPGGESKGDRYIVGGSATGAWSGYDDYIATYDGSSWEFTAPVEGMFTWVKDEDAIYYFITSWEHTIGFTEQITTGDGTTTIDWRLGNKFIFTYDAQNEIFTFIAPTKSCNLFMILIQDGVGGRTPTFPANVHGPNNGAALSWSSSGGAKDTLALYYSLSLDIYFVIASYNFAALSQ